MGLDWWEGGGARRGVLPSSVPAATNLRTYSLVFPFSLLINRIPARPFHALKGATREWPEPPSFHRPFKTRQRLRAIPREHARGFVAVHIRQKAFHPNYRVSLSFLSFFPSFFFHLEIFRLPVSGFVTRFEGASFQYLSEIGILPYLESKIEAIRLKERFRTRGKCAWSIQRR